MYPTPTCSRSQGPTTVPKTEADDFANFPWSELNTLPYKVKYVEPKSIDSIRHACTRKLAKLDEAKHKTENLKLLIAGIRTIMTQKWKIFLLYFNEDCRVPNRDRPWSHTEWRKWDVIEFLTRIAVSYNDACDKAANDGAELCTTEVDKEFFALVNDLSDLGAATEEKVLVIKEWERLGTKWTMESEGVTYSEFGYGWGERQD